MNSNSDSDNKDAESQDYVPNVGNYFDQICSGKDMFIFKNILRGLSINELKVAASLNWIMRDIIIGHINSIARNDPNQLSTLDQYYYPHQSLTLFDDIEINDNTDQLQRQKQNIIQCIIDSRVIDTIIVIGDKYKEIIFRIIDEESITAYINHVKHLSKPSNKNEFKLLIKNHLNGSIKFNNDKVKCDFCKQHYQYAKKQIGKVSPLFNPEKNGVKYKCGNLWTHVIKTHLKVFKAVYIRKIRLKTKSTARLLKSKSTQNIISENAIEPPIEQNHSNSNFFGLFEMISIRKKDEYLLVSNNVTPIETFLLNMKVSKKAIDFIISPHIDIVTDWFINPCKQSIFLVQVDILSV